MAIGILGTAAITLKKYQCRSVVPNGNDASNATPKSPIHVPMSITPTQSFSVLSPDRLKSIRDDWQKGDPYKTNEFAEYAAIKHEIYKNEDSEPSVYGLELLHTAIHQSHGTETTTLDREQVKEILVKLYGKPTHATSK